MSNASNKKAGQGRSGLTTIRMNVAGIDIGARKMHVAGPPGEGGRPRVKEFETTTDQILACGEWLKQLGVESVAMESTGVYWIPVLEILEGQGLEAIVVDTRPLSRVPGRKTDVTDCQWIQTLHGCGLLQGCYRPTAQVSQVRSLVRAKAGLMANQSDYVRRMQKALNQMNVRVHHAVSDIQGATGMTIIRAIVGGERDPKKLAQMRDPRCHKSLREIESLLTGHWRPDHLFNLEQNLKLFDAVAERVQAYEDEIQRRMKDLTPGDRQDLYTPPLSNPSRMKGIRRRGQEGKRQTLFRMAGVDLTTIPSIGVETAEVIFSEYGTDLGCFDNEHRFVAHAQLAPKHASSGGKPLKTRRSQSNATRTAQALRMAASTLRNSPTALGAYFRRISRSKGASIAVFASARKLAILIYRMLRWGQAYVDEGQLAYEQRFATQRLRSLANTARQLGYSLTPKPAPANP